jgi:hypothetical protein
MRYQILSLALLLAVAMAANYTEYQPVHNTDDIFAVVTETQRVTDLRFTTLEGMQKQAILDASASYDQKLQGMEDRMMAVENQEKGFIEDRTNPLRTNLLNIFFMSALCLYVLKKTAEDEMRFLQMMKPKEKPKAVLVPKPVPKAKPVERKKFLGVF